MSTIKEIIQNFCYRVNVPAPAAFVGVSSPAEQQYLSLFKRIGDLLRNRPYQWPQLKRGYTFLTQTNVQNYQLPGDFYRILNSTQWDITNQWPLQGPISDFQMAARDYAVVGLSNRKAYMLVGPTQYLYSTAPYNKKSAGWFQISPAGDNNTDELFLGYVTCNWIWPENWAASTVYPAGSIVAGNGYMYFTAAGGTSGADRPDWTTGSDTDGGVTWSVYHEPFLIESTNTELTDDCLCLFDDDLMIEGMRWAYYEAKGQDFQQIRADWEQNLKSSFSRFNGPTRISMAGIQNYTEDGWPLVPPGNWSV